jgi:tetratricopeptide (TPR) repeat protein
MKNSVKIVLAVLLPFLAFGDSPELPCCARSIGMSAFCGLSDGATSIFWNPGGLGLMDHAELSAMNVNLYPTDIRHTVFSSAFPTRFGTVGLGVKNLDLGDFDVRNSLGEITDSSCGRSDNTVVLSYGLNIPYVQVSAGISGKFVMITGQQPLADAKGNGIDLGVTRRFPFASNALTVGFCISNVGNTKVEDGDGVSQVLYLQNLKLGLAYSFKDAFSLAFDIDGNEHGFDRSGIDRISAGFECRVHPLLRIRAGLNTQLDAHNPLVYTGGFTFSLKGFSADYAYMSSAALKNLHYYSLSYGFGKRSPFQDSLKAAIHLYEQGDYESARNGFQSLTEHADTRETALEYFDKCRVIDSALTDIDRCVKTEEFALALSAIGALGTTYREEPGISARTFQLYCDLTRACIGAAHYPDAKNAYDQALSVKPDTSIPILAETITKGMQTAYAANEARVFLEKHDFDQARTTLEEILRRDPKNAEALGLMEELTRAKAAQAELNKGMDLYYNAEFRRTIEVLEKFIAAGKGDIAKAHFFNGCSYASMGLETKAKACFANTLELNPEFQAPQTISPKILNLFEQLR